MRRLVLISLILFLAIPLSAQYSWRFSPSYTFDAPALSKKDLASRAEDYRRFAHNEYNAPQFFQFDSMHQTNWFLFSDYKFKANGKEIYAIVEFFVTIVPEQGKYSVFVEKTDIFARSGLKILLDNEMLRSDDSVYSDKLTKGVVTQIKAFIQEQFDGLIPKLREIMENPVDGFWIQEETE